MTTIGRLRSPRTLGIAALACGLALGATLATAKLAPELIAPRVLAQASESVGKPAHSFPVNHLIGLPKTTRPILKLRGRIVLLQAFNIWSDHCIQAAEQLNKLHDQLTSDGLTILAVTEGEIEAVQPWLDEHKIQYATALLDAQDFGELRRHYHYPGEPWSFLIDPAGNVVWAGHPMEFKASQIRPFLDAVTVPPRLPADYADAQKLLDDGQWAAARKSLETRASADELDKVAKRWVRGTIGWVERRHGRVFAEAEKECADGRHWDGWKMLDEHPRKFAGMGGDEEAATRATAIRANPEAEDDLKAGDLVAKGMAYLADGKKKQGKKALDLVRKRYPDTRHAARAKLALLKLKRR